MTAPKKKDYENVITQVLEFANNLPNELVPDVIIHNGEIKSPGISDIDLIFGFNDNFLLSSYFLQLFNENFENLENRDIFFHHPPHIYPLSSIESLPEMTYNPASKINILKGSVKFTSKELNNNQNLLNSFEQIHNRITTLINISLNDTKNINQLLLVGHSLIHSINCLGGLGIELKINNFSNFEKIETMRAEITNGKKIDILNFNNLCRGLINECFEILNYLNKIIESKILIHFNKDSNFYQYDDNVFFVDVQNNHEHIEFKLTDNKILIKGLSWQTMCLFDNYFQKEDSFKTIFTDELFSIQIQKRIKFFKSIFRFNFANFNNPFGRTGLQPLIKGSKYYLSARNLII